MIETRAIIEKLLKDPSLVRSLDIESIVKTGVEMAEKSGMGLAGPDGSKLVSAFKENLPALIVAGKQTAKWIKQRKEGSALPAAGTGSVSVALSVEPGSAGGRRIATAGVASLTVLAGLVATAGIVATVALAGDRSKPRLRVER